nr:MAG TPA: hypothetical protein [Caudoviricetes sp.]
MLIVCERVFRKIFKTRTRQCISTSAGGGFNDF